MHNIHVKRENFLVALRSDQAPGAADGYNKLLF